MSLFENQSCPVCNRLFEEGDDIVVCPECGTPHHRECYALTGHCVNRGLHESGYSYYDEHKPIIEKKAEKAESKEEPKAQGPFPPIGSEAAFFNFTKTPYDADKTTINGESISDVACTVRTNTDRFVNVFKRMEQKKSRSGWNWGAFFFGAYYLFFRKMYKQAITLLCVNITLSSVLTLLASRLAPLTYEAMNELSGILTGGDTNAVIDKMNSIQSLSDFNKFTMLYMAFAAITVVIRLFVAVFADGMYKSTVTDIIKKVNEQLNDGAEFNTPTLSFKEEEAFNLSQEQLKKLYLARKGGVSIWAPCAAYFVIYLISTFI